MVRRKYIALFLCAALLGTVSGCSQKEGGKENVSDLSGHATVSKVTLTKGKYSEEKLDDTWDENAAVSLKFEEDSISASGAGETGADKVAIEGSTATISKAGTYILSGSLKDGQIVVDAAKDDYVKLVLNGADITCADSAPIYSKCGNLVITLAENTENTVTDGEGYVFEDGEDEPSAAIFAKDDLTFNGTGTLNVNANYNHAVLSKDDLKFVAGTYVMKAAGDAVVGKDSVSVKDGNFTIESGEDGIKATNIEDPEKGYVLIENGTFQITAGGDGIQAETLLRVNDGKLDIETGGGSGEAVMTGDLMEGGFGRRGKMKEGEVPEGGEMPEGEMPEGEMPEDEMPEGEMPEGGDKLELEKPEGGDRPEGEMSQGEDRLEGNVPQGGDRPKGEMPQGGEKPEGEMAQGGEMPQGGERPEGEIPQGGEKTESASDFSRNSPQGEVQEKNDAPGMNADTSENMEETVSTKGLKSYVELVIAGGEFALDSCDDGLHSNQNATIKDGTFTIQSGDDGIHADQNLTIDGGAIDITQSYEGLEGYNIVINAGDIKVAASDDGVNAAGDDDSAQNPEEDASEQASDEEPKGEDSPAGNEPQMKRGGFMAGEDQGAAMTVNGGTLYVNANGDGLDANGDIFLNGGTVTVHGPASGGNGTLDYATSCKITGGVFLGVGSIGMAQSPSDDSTQPSLVGTLDSAVEAGTTISVKTADGKTVASVVTEKQVQWYMVSSPELKQGESYIVCVGEEEKPVELSEVVTEVK